MAWSLQDFTTYLFRLNCIFKPFNTNLHSKRKLDYNQDIWSPFFPTNLVDFIFHDCYHDNGSHSNGFNNTIMTQRHIAWSDYLIYIQSGPMLSHVLCGSWIHDPFTHALGTCLYSHYKCIIIIFFCNYKYFCEDSMKMSGPIFFVVTPWRYPHLWFFVITLWYLIHWTSCYTLHWHRLQWSD